MVEDCRFSFSSVLSVFCVVHQSVVNVKTLDTDRTTSERTEAFFSVWQANKTVSNEDKFSCKRSRNIFPPGFTCLLTLPASALQFHRGPIIFRAGHGRCVDIEFCTQPRLFDTKHPVVCLSNFSLFFFTLDRVFPNTLQIFVSRLTETFVERAFELSELSRPRANYCSPIGVWTGIPLQVMIGHYLYRI